MILLSFHVFDFQCFFSDFLFRDFLCRDSFGRVVFLRYCLSVLFLVSLFSFFFSSGVDFG